MANLVLYEWKNVSIEEIEKRMYRFMDAYRAEIQRLIDRGTPLSNHDFDELDEIGAAMRKTWSPVSHLKGVDDPRIDKDAFLRVLTKWTAFGNEIAQNERWYEMSLAFRDSEEYETLSAEEKRLSKTL